MFIPKLRSEPGTTKLAVDKHLRLLYKAVPWLQEMPDSLSFHLPGFLLLTLPLHQGHVTCCLVSDTFLLQPRRFILYLVNSDSAGPLRTPLACWDRGSHLAVAVYALAPISSSINSMQLASVTIETPSLLCFYR